MTERRSVREATPSGGPVSGRPEDVLAPEGVLAQEAVLTQEEGLAHEVGLAQEEVLQGGTANRGQVVRVGDTVRRPQRSTSPATHALLRHLEDVGFDGAPRFLGVDDQGREVLSFLPGTPVVPPYPEWALTEEALVSVAQLLRSYHRAVESFDPAPHLWPPSPPAAYVDGLVSHNDLNLDNVVFRDGRAVALIDFDLASPGSRLWDVACAARLWAPLRPDSAVDDGRRGYGLARFRLFVDSYGVPARERPRVVEAVRQNHGWFRELIRTHAEEGHAVFAEHWNPEARERARRFGDWFATSEQAMRQALGSVPPRTVRQEAVRQGAAGPGAAGPGGARQGDTTPEGR